MESENQEMGPMTLKPGLRHKTHIHSHEQDTLMFLLASIILGPNNNLPQGTQSGTALGLYRVGYQTRSLCSCFVQSP